MKTKHLTRLNILLGIGVAALGLTLGSSLAWAVPDGPCSVVVDPTTDPPTEEVDTDCDGFHDSLESGTGVTLNVGTAPSVTFPPCDGVLARSDCMDSNDPDVFIVLARANPTRIPADPLECISRALADGGLGIAKHVLTPDQVSSTRQVTSATPQKAVRITEGTSGTGTTFGIANRTGPNGVDAATVYPVRIENFVLGVYAEKNQSPPAGLVDDYVTEIVCHECGHVLGLTFDFNKRFNGNHNKTGTGNIMEQNVKYTVKGGNITFFVSLDFTPADPEATCLNELDLSGNCLTTVQ